MAIAWMDKKKSLKDTKRETEMAGEGGIEGTTK